MNLNNNGFTKINGYCNRLISVLLVLIFTFSVSSIAYGSSHEEPIGPGMSWKKDGETGKWRYLKQGSFVCDDWVKTKNLWYLFDEEGFMMTGWVEKNGKLYFLNPTEGADSLPEGALYISGLTPDGYYVNADGERVTGASEDNPLADPSCVEVNITEQIVNVYLDKKLVLSTPCVTGNHATHADTPTGRYGINKKETERYLRGYNANGTKYASYVHFWMPFNGGIGLHDATWRNKFGGNIYATGGSHGCINLPLAAATQIFGTVDVGWPVIVHY